MYSNFKLKKPSEKKFGYTISLILIIITFYIYIFHNNFLEVLIISSFLLTMTTFLKPSVLRILNNLWFKFGMLLGLVVSPIVLLIIYLTTFFPIGIILKILNKDLLLLKKQKSSKTYWIKYNDDDNKSMKNQF